MTNQKQSKAEREKALSRRTKTHSKVTTENHSLGGKTTIKSPDGSVIQEPGRMENQRTNQQPLLSEAGLKKAELMRSRCDE